MLKALTTLGIFGRNSMSVLLKVYSENEELAETCLVGIPIGSVAHITIFQGGEKVYPKLVFSQIPQDVPHTFRAWGGNDFDLQVYRHHSFKGRYSFHHLTEGVLHHSLD